MSTVFVRVLGPVVLEVHGEPVPLPRRRERCLLAVLALEANKPVPAERLMTLLWGDEALASPAQLHVCMSRVRAALPRGDSTHGVSVGRRSGSYILSLPPDSVDAGRFAALVRTASTTSRPDERGDLLHEALALWRGPPLADVGSGPLLETLRSTLDEQRRAALVARIDADLALGRHNQLIGELSELVARHPLSELFATRLMIALSRSGRRSDALETYRRTRQQLANELGLDPSEELRRIEAAVLRDEAAPLPWSPGTEPGRAVRAGQANATPDRPPAPAHLPAATPDFIGRQRELAQLDSWLGLGHPPGTVVLAISGPAGAGKTALALYWGHRVAGSFPDGQLHVDLRGWSTHPPAPPLEVTSFLLRVLDVPDDLIPTDLDEATARLRTTLASRRLLILLDNAASADQVRPVLPGIGPSLVLVTSRERLTGLVVTHGAHVVDLDVMTSAEAVALLAAIVGPQLVDAQPQAAAELVALCGRLPLAVRIAAAHLASRPDGSIAEYVAALRSAADRVGALAIDGDPHSAVGPAFDFSLSRLTAGEQATFALLGSVPGTDVSLPAAAVLAGIGDDEAARIHAKLARLHLVDRHPVQRFAMHELLRLYAARRSRDIAPATRGDALARLYDWYFWGADRAARLLRPDMPRLPIPDGGPADGGSASWPHFTTKDAALCWLDAERHNLVAAVPHAAAHGQGLMAILLCDALRTYLVHRRHVGDLVATGNTALAAAQAQGDTSGQAAAELSLALVDYIQNRSTETMGRYRSAYQLALAGNWDAGAACALASLGVLLAEEGQLDQAAEYCAEAIALEQRAGRQAGLASLLIRAGSVEIDLGRYHQAAAYFSRALALDQASGNEGGQVIDHGYLGHVLHVLGDPDQEALIHLNHALDLARTVGHEAGEALVLDGLAMVCRDSGRLDDAIDHARAAYAITQRLGSDRMMAWSLNTQGTILEALGRQVDAVASHERALALALATGSVDSRILAHIGLSTAQLRDGQPALALEHAEAAQALATSTGHLDLLARAKTAHSHALLSLGQVTMAISSAEAATSLHRRTGHRRALARSQEILATALSRNGRPAHT